MLLACFGLAWFLDSRTHVFGLTFVTIRDTQPADTDAETMSGVLNRQLNTLAGRSTHAVVKVAAAAAARHSGRSPSSASTAAFVSIARSSSSSSLAGRASDTTTTTNNSNDANRNRLNPASGGCESGAGAGYRKAPPSAGAGPASSTGSRADGGESAARHGMGAEAPALAGSASAGGTMHGGSGGGAKRASSSMAASSAGTGARAASPPSSSLLAPAASAYSSSSLLAPSATNGGGGGGAARVDAVVIGAGQAGLSVAYHLQKAGGLRVVALDANQVCMYL